MFCCCGHMLTTFAFLSGQCKDYRFNKHRCRFKFHNPNAKACRAIPAQFGHHCKTINRLFWKPSCPIANGAPFQLFFSADQEKPKALIESGIAARDSKITYAIGKLRLWTIQANADPLDMLVSGSFSKMALANPSVAPYGEAADSVLKSLGLREKYINRRVIGQNIAQTFLYVESGNADLGFISVTGYGTLGSVWDVPSELYKPIKQDAVLINNRSIKNKLKNS